jgi:beta-glucosidase
MFRFALLSASLSSAFSSPAALLPAEDAVYRNASAPVNARVSDLISRMTLEEKVAQLLNPWPTSFNCRDILRDYGNTSVGAVYAYSIVDCVDGLNNSASLNFLQEALTTGSRLGIPVATISETLHSSLEGGTAFPNPTLLGQTWNETLIRAVGEVIGAEARANGVTRGFAPVLQVVSDSRFGRYEEAFGECPLVVARMGVAMIQGQQGTGGPSNYLEDVSHVSCEAKHAIAYAASGRDWYRADVTERTLMDIYARPWRDAIRAGLRGLMVTHPEVAGCPMHGNGPVLTGVLRGLFNGSEMFFASDAGDVSAISRHGITTNDNESAIYALTAGLDQELVTTCFPSLVASVRSGAVDEAFVDAAASRVLREKFALRLFDGPQYWKVDFAAAAALLDAPAHRALSRAAASEGIVLLQNAPAAASPNGPSTPILPLRGLGAALTRVAVVGPNGGCVGGGDGCAAARAYRGGYCSSGSRTLTLLDALSAVPGVSVSFAPGANITDAGDESGIPAALAAAAAAQVVIAVVGDTAAGFGKGTCAEGIDADTIDLPGSQLALLAALADAGAPLVVVGVHGRPFTLGAGPTSRFGANNALLARLPALLAAFRPGEDGGGAILDVLTGAANPSARLTANWVRHVGALRGPASPYFQARGAPTTAYVTEPATPLFAFGSGLSYNEASIASAALAPAGAVAPDAILTVSGTLANAGPAGAAVVQVYFSQDAPTKEVRYASQLAGFAKIALPADAAAVPFNVTVQVADMAAWDTEARNYVVYQGTYTLRLALNGVADAAASPHVFSVPVDGVPWCRPRYPGAPACEARALSESALPAAAAVAAAPAAAPRLPVSPRGAASAASKRGLSAAANGAQGPTMCADFAAAQPAVSWLYSWSLFPANESCPGVVLPFEPMFWGSASTKNASALFATPASTAVLGFNEPNGAGQSDLTPAEAASLWPVVAAAAKAHGLALVAPAPSGTDTAWLDAFFSLCAGCEADIAAIAMHPYVCNEPGLRGALDAFAKFGKPLWVTEFNCGDGMKNATAAEHLAWMKIALPILDADARVERYAWMSGRNKKVPGSALFDGPGGSLTQLGRFYISA